MFSKHSTQTVIVLKNGATVPTAGTTRLYNSSTDALNLAVGAGSVFRPVAGSGNPICCPTLGLTIANTPSIEIIQRRDTSGDASPLPPRPLERSESIHGNCLYGLRYTGKAASSPTNDFILVGAAVAAAGQITIDDELTYEVRVSADGDRVDKYWSHYNTPYDYGTFTSPVWADTTYTTVAQQLDYTIKALCENFNKNERNMSIAIPLSTTDGQGSVSTGCTSIADAIALGVGGSFIIGYTRSTEPIRVTIDKSVLQTLTDLEAYAIATLGLSAGDLVIMPYAYPSSGNVTNAPAAAIFGAGTCDLIGFMSQDYTLSYYDENMNTKTNINVGLTQGFAATVTKQTAVDASEGTGQARQLLKYYEYQQDFKKYSSRKAWNGMSITYPTGILSDATYDIYVIEHCNTRVTNSGTPSYSPHITTIAIVSFEDPTTSYYTGSANPQKTQIQAQLNAYFALHGLAAVSL